MSYCRFGPESDIHCYKNDEFNIVVSVAGTRVDSALWKEGEIATEELYRIANKPVEVILLPHAGDQKKFCFLEHARDWMLELADLGYRVPDEGLKLMNDEINEARKLVEGERLDQEISDNSQATLFKRDDGEYSIFVHLKKEPEGVSFDGLSLYQILSLECQLPHA